MHVYTNLAVFRGAPTNIVVVDSQLLNNLHVFFIGIVPQNSTKHSSGLLQSLCTSPSTSKFKSQKKTPLQKEKVESINFIF